VSPLRREVRKLAGLAGPVAGTQVGFMLLGTVDTLMVARVGIDALAAAAIANAWIFGVLLLGQGVVHGIDPIVTYAHGARDGEGAAVALQRGLVLALLASLPLAALLAGSETFLLLLGQDPDLSRDAARYTLVQIPSVPMYLAFMALRQYLQGRELMRPALWVILVANFFNVAANYVLIFGKLGVPALGLVGAGIATGLTRGVMLVALVALVRAFGLHHQAWVPWSRAAFDPRALGRVLALGAPIALQMAFEVCAFSGAALLAGRLGAEPLAAHTIALNMAALSFMVPLGISQGAVTRVGNLLGARDPTGAQRAAWVAIAMGGGVMMVSAIVFVALRHALPLLYTDELAVVSLCAGILPIAAAFQVFDGIQVVGCGVLRGMGQTKPAAAFTLVAYWVLAIPLGYGLGLCGGWGLPGIWWGLCLGLACVAISLVLWIRWRGPA
jgi:MATE family multidrug resistance protein